MGETETPRRNLTRAVVPALAAAVLAGLGTMLVVGRNGDDVAVGRECTLGGLQQIGGPIDLVGGDGAAVTQADFAGRPTVVYFGFAHCPDVCPTSMLTLAEALKQVRTDVRPVLVTVDPERDTPALMRDYVQTSGFPPGLIGLSGSREQVDAAIAAFRVTAVRANIPGAPDDVYNVDHSSFLYVLDGNWRTVSIVQTIRREREDDPRSPMIAVPPAEIAACISAGLRQAA
ncbi:MAG: SCO family protein [Hyphomonadaceae bacterium]